MVYRQRRRHCGQVSEAREDFRAEAREDFRDGLLIGSVRDRTTKMGGRTFNPQQRDAKLGRRS